MLRNGWQNCRLEDSLGPLQSIRVGMRPPRPTRDILNSTQLCHSKTRPTNSIDSLHPCLIDSSSGSRYQLSPKSPSGFHIWWSSSARNILRAGRLNLPW